MGLFNRKKSREHKLQESIKGQMDPDLVKIVYAKYSDNLQMHSVAKALSSEQVDECYQSAVLLMGFKSYSEQTHQIMALAAMGGHADACVRMGFLQPVVEEIWRGYCEAEKYESAKAALMKIVGTY